MMPRPTRNSALTPVLPRIPTTSKKPKSSNSPSLDTFNPSHEHDINVDSLSEEGRLLYTLLTRKLQAFFDEIKVKNEQLERCERENGELRCELAKLEERMDSLESHSRGSNMVLSGAVLPDNPGNLTQSVFELLRNKVRYELSPHSILSVYRTGPKNVSQSPDNGKLMIKLRDQEVKKDIMSAFRTIKPSRLYANDDLTSHRAKLLHLLRVAKRKYSTKITACGSMDCNVYAYLKPPNPSARSQRVFINSMRKLDELCIRELSTSLAALTGESDQD